MSKFDVLEQFTKHRKDHKSTVFLYAILQFSTEICKPLNTYLHLNEVKDYKDRYLFALFNPAQQGYSECKKAIEEHELWDFCLTDEDGYDLHVFTFEKYFQYFDQVMIGNYSEILTEFRLILGKANHPIAAIGMNPSQYHDSYVTELKIPAEQVPVGTQLIQKPKMEDETLMVSKIVINQFRTLRGDEPQNN